MSFIGNSLSPHVLLRFRFSQGPPEFFSGSVPNVFFRHPPKTDDPMTLIAGVIVQILGA
jgi:hypothetical protein